MDFSLDRFYRLNRRMIIWLVLLALLYLLRDFLLLIFLIFIIGFFAYPVAQFMAEKLRMSHGFATNLVYTAILLCYAGLVWWVTPNIVSEATKLGTQIPAIRENLNDLRTTYAEKYPQLASFAESFAPKEEVPVGQEVAERETQAMLVEILHELKAQRGEDGEALIPPELLDEQIEAVLGTRSEKAAAQETKPLGTEPPANDSGDADPGAVSILPGATDIASAPGSEIPGDAEEAAAHEIPADVAAKLDGKPVGFAFIDRQVDVLAEHARRGLAQASGRALGFIIQSLLAIVFSYLIVLDFGRLTRELSGLKTSKLRDFYEEAGQPVVSFALAVGRGFQAIAVIAFITTLMMAVVFFIFQIPQVILLCTIVFVSSLIPIVGVVFEAAAVLLVTFNAHGVGDYHFWGMATGLVIVHLIITYAIAPIIFGRQFRLNIVLVLIILYLGQQMAGMWGLILGVPVANYFIRDVFAVPLIEEHELSTKKSRSIEIRGEDPATPSETRP